MNRFFLYSMALMSIAVIGGCKSVSRYTIDSKPLIKADTGLLGIWKAVEDTDKANYILIQNNFDVHHRLDSYKPNDYYYYISYVNHHGTNSGYAQFEAFTSAVAHAKFLNIQYHYPPFYNKPYQFASQVKPDYVAEETVSGYFFVRLIAVSADRKKITTAVVADTTLTYLVSPAQVRSRIAKNINNPAFYSDTLHFYKVSGFHESLNESKLKAN